MCVCTQISRMMTIAASNRSVGTTKLNIHSSRSHLYVCVCVCACACVCVVCVVLPLVSFQRHLCVRVYVCVCVVRCVCLSVRGSMCVRVCGEQKIHIIIITIVRVCV